MTCSYVTALRKGRVEDPGFKKSGAIAKAIGFLPELRPRERLLSEGAEALSSAELLGILFGIGSKEKTAVELASEVIFKMQLPKHKTT